MKLASLIIRNSIYLNSFRDLLGIPVKIVKAPNLLQKSVPICQIEDLLLDVRITFYQYVEYLNIKLPRSRSLRDSFAVSAISSSMPNNKLTISSYAFASRQALAFYITSISTCLSSPIASFRVYCRISSNGN